MSVIDRAFDRDKRPEAAAAGDGRKEAGSDVPVESRTRSEYAADLRQAARRPCRPGRTALPEAAPVGGRSADRRPPRRRRPPVLHDVDDYRQAMLAEGNFPQVVLTEGEYEIIRYGELEA